MNYLQQFAILFKHCIQSVTAVKHAEAMDRCPVYCPPVSGTCESSQTLCRHLGEQNGQDWNQESTLRGELDNFSDIHGTSFHGLSIEYLKSCHTYV